MSPASPPLSRAREGAPRRCGASLIKRNFAPPQRDPPRAGSEFYKRILLGARITPLTNKQNDEILSKSLSLLYSPVHVQSVLFESFRLTVTSLTFIFIGMGYIDTTLE